MLWLSVKIFGLLCRIGIINVNTVHMPMSDGCISSYPCLELATGKINWEISEERIFNSSYLTYNRYIEELSRILQWTIP